MSFLDDEELNQLLKSGYFQENSDMQKGKEMVPSRLISYDSNDSLKALLDKYVSSKI